jgi:hypothetical protein
MPLGLEMNRTYFQNRITEDDLASLLVSGNSFFLESVTDVDGTATLCEKRLAGNGRHCRVEDRRMSWANEAGTLLPWPVTLIIAAWTLTKDARQRLRRGGRADVVIIKRAGSLHIRFGA